MRLMWFHLFVYNYKTSLNFSQNIHIFVMNSTVTWPINRLVYIVAFSGVM